MEHRTEFDLKLAIKEHLQKVDRHHLLNRDERDELFDHFLSGTEELIQQGLTEEEAFDNCAKRFGETALISSEYATARPFGAAMVAAVGGLLLFFGIPALNALMMTITALSYRGGQLIGFTPTWIQLGDLGVKILLIGGIATYLVYRFKRRPFFRKMELWAIPVLVFLMFFGSQQLLNACYDRQSAFSHQIELMGKMFTVGNFLSYLAILTPVVCFSILRYKARRTSGIFPANGGLNGSFLVFFYLILGVGSINLLSTLSIYGGYWMGISEAGIKLGDILIKVLMMMALIAYATYRLKDQVPFGRIESILLPAFSLICPFMADWSVILLNATWVHVSMINRTLINSAMIFISTFIVLIVIYYVLIAREQKRLVVG